MTELDTIIERCRTLLSDYPIIKEQTPNDRLFLYWKVYDGFGDIYLKPCMITNYHSIDRAFRKIMPSEYKNYRAEKQYREALKPETN